MYVLPVAAVVAIAVLGGIIGVITIVCCLNRKKRKREEFAGLKACFCLWLSCTPCACSCVMKYYSADLSEMRDPPILLDSIRESVGVQ